VQQTLAPALQRWVLGVLGAGASITEIRGLGDGGSPWLLRLTGAEQEQDVVLRVGNPVDRSPLRTELAALQLAATHDVAVPRLTAAAIEHDPPLVLTEAVSGSSAIPDRHPAERLRILGASAAGLHRIAVSSNPALPRRDRPIAGVDFASLRANHPIRPLLARAEHVVGERAPSSIDGFVHGDLWQGNTMWNGDTLTALIDWDCAGVGPAGVDLGSLRCDAAICHGLPAAEDVLTGWRTAAGRPADDVAYWDAVAALSTPPDMGWFVDAIAGQGRTDLTQSALLRRRDDFLAAALDRLDP